MPAFIHQRAEHISAKNPGMPKSEAFAIATQQSHALGKSPKGYGTSEGRATAKAKYDTPKDDKKTANPGGLESAKFAALADEILKLSFSPGGAMSRIGGALANPNVREHGTELAGLGILAVPGLDTLQAHARARLAGDKGPGAVEKRQFMGEAGHAAADVGGLGVLMGPEIAKLMKHAGTLIPVDFAKQVAKNFPARTAKEVDRIGANVFAMPTGLARTLRPVRRALGSGAVPHALAGLGGALYGGHQMGKDKEELQEAAAQDPDSKFLQLASKHPYLLGGAMGGTAGVGGWALGKHLANRGLPEHIKHGGVLDTLKRVAMTDIPGTKPWVLGNVEKATANTAKGALRPAAMSGVRRIGSGAVGNGVYDVSAMARKMGV